VHVGQTSKCTAVIIPFQRSPLFTISKSIKARSWVGTFFLLVPPRDNLE
jgi:hypothetical protein